jgi:hypothetical protein
MRFEKKYLIQKWTDWNHKLSESIDDFYVNFSYNPNIIEANNHTYSQFDFLINEMPNEKQKVNRTNELTNKIEKPNDDEYIGISTFETMKASVDFAIDIKLKDKEFRLIYDSDPDWGDDDIIVDSPVNEFEKTIA